MRVQRQCINNADIQAYFLLTNFQMTTGLAFPLQIATNKGDLLLYTDAKLYESHILNWLLTVPKERVMRLRYGMQDFLFDAVSNTAEIVAMVKAGLKEYVPSVTIHQVTVMVEGGNIAISVYWSYQYINQEVIRISYD